MINISEVPGYYTEQVIENPILMLKNVLVNVDWQVSSRKFNGNQVKNSLTGSRKFALHRIQL